MNIGRIIKTLRVAAGLNQKQLAEQLNISASALSLYENGEREPNMTVLKAISRHFGVPVSVLFFEGEPVPEGLTEEQANNYSRVQDLMMDVLKSAMFATAKEGPRSKSKNE
jgi:transcriptional regulator with XRE-family HTH domain